MSLRKLLWDNEQFDPKEPVWWLTGTAYTEDGDLIQVKYRVPADRRLQIMKDRRLRGGLDSFNPPDNEIIRLDR